MIVPQTNLVPDIKELIVMVSYIWWTESWNSSIYSNWVGKFIVQTPYSHFGHKEGMRKLSLYGENGFLIKTMRACCPFRARSWGPASICLCWHWLDIDHLLLGSPGKPSSSGRWSIDNPIHYFSSLWCHKESPKHGVWSIFLSQNMVCNVLQQTYLKWGSYSLI